MKKIFSIGVLFIVFAAVVVVLGLAWWGSNTSAVDAKSEETQRIVIPRGRSAVQVGNMLHEEGLIKSPLAFKMYVQIFDKSKNINAGQFELSPAMSVAEVVDALGEGPLELWVTVPEGLRREQIVERFVTGLEKSGADADKFRSSFLTASKGKEGYLYPNTYLFPPDATGAQVVAGMTALFEKETADIFDDISGGRTVDDVVILASLVEKETKTDEERPTVAGIILKRIANDWTIDIDASVQYQVANRDCGIDSLTCDDWWPTIYRGDIEQDGPYNVYQRQGLPVAPIANPGLSSLKAAVYPEDSDYWFYIHTPNGQIYYGETLEEHNANVQKYLR